MTWRPSNITVIAISIVFSGLPGLCAAGSPDIDGTGYVDTTDYAVFQICFSMSGPDPEEPILPECTVRFDSDDDGDVDLADLAAFERALGHLPIPLRDALGNTMTIDSTRPFNGRHTCAGNCHAHDIEYIANGLHFQQGRSDLDGNVIMKDDYYEDGRWWHKSPGRYGRWSPAAATELAGKQSASESEIDLTAFGWVGPGTSADQCGGCHAGGGMGEFDRDGLRLYDEATGKFGYQLLDKTAEEVRLDGDYAYMDTAGILSPARWDITGVSAPDCLLCHRRERVTPEGESMNQAWRAACFRSGTRLVDGSGASVPAFAAAATAGQGWFSQLATDVEPPVLQIDYSVGVANGSLVVDDDGNVCLAPVSYLKGARDQACMGCHEQTLPGGKWFDGRDIHYSKFNGLGDNNPSNDVPPEQSKVCSYCHPGNLEHNFAKGNTFESHWRDELDWVDFRSCRDCHMSDSPVRHPDAPEVPGSPRVHKIGGRMDVVSCQACHIPYSLGPLSLALSHSTLAGGPPTPEAASPYYSADPLDPSDTDKSRWYPGFDYKIDSDGERRLFPVLFFPSVYWADWQQNGTPEDLSDDKIKPIITWRIKQITGGVALPGVTDDNGDSRPEVNRLAEILAYIQALKGDDSYGNQVAANPVLVKGGYIWHEDPAVTDGVSSFKHEDTGILIEWQGRAGDDPRGMDHNVLAAEESWGYNDPDDPEDGCNDCHRYDGKSPVFDRLIMVDPWDPDGNPVYAKVRDMTDLSPP